MLEEQVLLEESGCLQLMSRMRKEAVGVIAILILSPVTIKDATVIRFTDFISQ